MPRQTLTINDAEAVALMAALEDQQRKYLEWADDCDREGDDGAHWRQLKAQAARLHDRITKRPFKELAKR